MSKVVFDISMSLDGYITASNRRSEEPMGDGGERLHEWAMTTRTNPAASSSRLGSHPWGAVITGRKTYDDSLPRWNADGPSGRARLPVFVVTHEAPSESPEGGVYTFVTDGIESALRQAKVAAGDKDVSVMGGASIGQQYIAAGLVDELSIHLVPVLFSSGLRMFEQLGDEHIQLEPPEVLETPAAVHLRFHVAT